jgi:hypothetical protein
LTRFDPAGGKAAFISHHRDALLFTLVATGALTEPRGKIIVQPGLDCEYIGQSCEPLPGWHFEDGDLYGNTIAIPDIADPHGQLPFTRDLIIETAR